MSECLVRCENVTLGYNGNAVAEHIDFSVNAGDYLCVVGENGSGKSTLVKTLLSQCAPLAGKIESAFKAGEIGYLPQHTSYQQDFPAKVSEIVLSGRLGAKGLFGIMSGADRLAARESLEKLGASDLYDKPYKYLSGGQRQRVLLARALCASRKLLLLDEPTTGLDPETTAALYKLIHDLNEREGIAVIMVTHDISGALPYASHVLHLGDKSFFGTAAAYENERKGGEADA